ncbi:uncharacterized protein LOC111710619 [Eurytemora carolleeae]|uniref:uncharacterized protein LOC111710619 n=1 Tax=Eurytemora carolleeae TaxID=1294199 RepID=UPI000C77F622|nr:uncharacterized protein LOC111710619 [Eurytemora carolleeae]|eukprot:XP_023340502.1 uncharacterized protein LOC111710619 [Eurytemora affinis]
MVTLKPGKRPNILKSLSAQNSVPGNSLPVTPFCCRLRNTNNLNTSISSTSNSGTTSPPSFVCSVDYAESPVPSPSEEQFVEDEFAIFVKASIHPPNELSVPRCYPDASTRVLVEPQAAANNQKNYLRSKSVSSPYAPGRSLISQRSLGSPGSRPSSPRPRLRRESAQEIEDGDYTPGASLEPGADRQFKQPGSIGTKGLSVYNHQVPRCPSPLLQPRLPLHRSAPGTPSTHFSVPRSSRSPCRTPSDESYLKVPYIRTRGTSLPESMEDSISDNLYLLRQFNIRGKKVVHVGDSFQTRARSNSSVNSNFSGGTGGQSQYSSRTGSCISSMENYSSTEDEPSIISNDQIQTFRDCRQSERGEKSVCIQLEDIECELVFIDRPRTEISAENLLSSYSADCAVVVFSVTDDGSLQEAREVLNILWQSGSLASRAVILVGNKTDLVRTRTVPIDEARSIASSHDCKYCEVSAALDHNVDSLLVGIVKQIHLKLFSHLQTKRSKGRLYTR